MLLYGTEHSLENSPVYLLQVSYLYTSHGDDRVPLPLLCDLLNSQSERPNTYPGSALTFVPCDESSTGNSIGYLVFASGPDLCTLSVSPSMLVIVKYFSLSLSPLSCW